ncbi:hypothetical protein Tco_0886125 [Tanacetum coccineum]
MIRLRDLGANTLTGVPYTKDQIMVMVRKGRQWGGTSSVLVGLGRLCARTAILSRPRCMHTDADIDEVKEDNKRLRKELSLLRDDEPGADEENAAWDEEI